MPGASMAGMKVHHPLGLLLCSLAAAAMAQTEVSHPFKLTLGEYRYSDGTHGEDVNLRWQRGDDTHAWLAGYHDDRFGSQVRAGADGAWDLGRTWTLQPSFQWASGGFWGGSLNLQVGDPWFALLGWGRTNLRPYMNLNFDPNDAITAGGGWHGDDGRSLSLFVVSDDRLGTGQQDWHLLGRWPLPELRRLTVDLLHKRGQGDAGPVSAWGLSVGLDFPAWFLRLTRDPKQNFSALDATRLAGGVRF
jgi:hypothetical protein